MKRANGARSNGLKARNITAQGNALGAANINSGQRPGDGK